MTPAFCSTIAQDMAIQDLTPAFVILAPIGDGAAFHQGQNAVADYLVLNTQVVLVRELHDHGLLGYGMRAPAPKQQKEGELKLPRHAWFPTTTPFVAQ